jgi:hypothetical protein
MSDWMRTSSATENTDLKPKPFSPICLSATDAFLELLPVAQMASTFARLKPSSLVSTMNSLGVTRNVRQGVRMAGFVYRESSAF